MNKLSTFIMDSLKIASFIYTTPTLYRPKILNKYREPKQLGEGP